MSDKDILLVKKANELYKNYMIMSQAGFINQALDIFEELYPGWLEIYNEREESAFETENEEVEELVMSTLPENANISWFYERENVGDNNKIKLERMAKILHLSNKIAHGMENLIKYKLSQYIKQEMEKGNTSIGNGLNNKKAIVKDETYEGVTSDFYFGFIDNFPFYLDLLDPDTKDMFTEFVSVNRKMDEMQKRIDEIKAEIDEAIYYIQGEQKLDLGDENYADKDLFKYLKTLKRKRSLEEKEELTDAEQKILEYLTGDRVSLTNYIEPAELDRIEELYLEKERIFEEKEALKEDSKFYADYASEKLNRKLTGPFLRLYGFMKEYGLDENHIFELSKIDFAEFKRTYDNFMDLKNRTIIGIHEFIQENGMKYISYGTSRPVESNDEKDDRNIFTIDVSGCGQISVHFLPEILTDKINQNYRMPTYDTALSNSDRREQVLLLYRRSKALKEFEDRVKRDDSNDAKMGINENTPIAVKESMRKKYAILSLELGDDISEDKKWKEYQQKYNINDDENSQKTRRIKVSEARQKRKAIRHQLGVLMGLSRIDLEDIYKFEHMFFDREDYLKYLAIEEPEKRNEFKIGLFLDRIKTKVQKKEIRFNDSRNFRPNHGYQKNSYGHKNKKDSQSYPDFGED